ncbi:MAG: hypothetical protein QGG42_16700 [Phycisphaerae bacterium]|jgi:hypothetical protein|nr:hypothetical protein [Phycisphaerae bacterium]
MDDKNDTTRSRVDGLLQQWGAAEAAKQAAEELSAPVAPKAAPSPGRSRAGVLLRWAPVGIAASLLLASGVLFMSSRHGSEYSVEPRATRAPGGEHIAKSVPETQPVDLSVELAAARAEAIEARSQAAEARTAIAKVLEQKQADDLRIKELRAQITRQSRKVVGDRTEWKVMETKLTSLISKAEQSTKDARGELQKVQKELADAKAAGIKTPADNEELKSLKTRLAVAVSELKRQQDTFRTANAERDKAKQALAALKANHQASLDQIRRVYLAASAPGKTGLAALQEAIKRRGLLKRCVALQRKARTAADKKLLARTEVVLTRLGLLDLSDSSAVRSYVTRLNKSDLLASLDASLGPMSADADTQDWLFETNLILTGVQRVG